MGPSQPMQSAERGAPANRNRYYLNYKLLRKACSILRITGMGKFEEVCKQFDGKKAAGTSAITRRITTSTRTTKTEGEAYWALLTPRSHLVSGRTPAPRKQSRQKWQRVVTMYSVSVLTSKIEDLLQTIPRSNRTAYKLFMKISLGR